MLEGYQNSSPISVRVGTAASSPQTSLKVNVKMAHPLMGDVWSDNSTIKSGITKLDFTFDGDDGHQLTSVGDPGMPYGKNKKLQVIACNGDGAVV